MKKTIIISDNYIEVLKDGYNIVEKNIENDPDEIRFWLDTFLDKWLKAKGLSDEQIAELDYSSFDDELYSLLDYARSRRG